MFDEKQFIANFKQNYRRTERQKNIKPRTPESVIHALAKQACLEKQYELGIINQVPELRINKKKKDLIAFLSKKPKKHDSNKIKIISKPQKAKEDDWRIKYNIYMNSKAWREKRKEYQQDQSRYQNCWSCNEEPKTVIIQFHHLHYDTLGSESLDDIIPLCMSCHKNLHTKYNIAKAKKPSLSLKKFSLEFCKDSEKFRNSMSEF